MQVDGRSSLGDATCKKTSSTIACEMRYGFDKFDLLYTISNALVSQRIARTTENRAASKERNLRTDQALREFREAS